MGRYGGMGRAIDLSEALCVAGGCWSTWQPLGTMEITFPSDPLEPRGIGALVRMEMCLCPRGPRTYQ